jgi:hypothetical protein
MSDLSAEFVSSSDLSGSVVASADVPSPDPVSAPVPPSTTQPQSESKSENVTALPEQTLVVVPAPAPAPAPALTKELSDALDGIVNDLSGVNASSLNVGDLIRFVPRLAALVHSLQIRGAEKREMVMSASHILVSRVIPESDRASAHALVDVVFPPAIAGVIDVVNGRVSFEQAAVATASSTVSAAAANPIVVSTARNCLTQLLSCLRKH